jgi:hypothetical protein
MTPSGALRKIEASLGTEVDPRGVSYILHASAVQHVDPILHVTPTSLATMLTPRHSHVNEDRDGLEFCRVVTRAGYTSTLGSALAYVYQRWKTVRDYEESPRHSCFDPPSPRL